MIEKLYLVGNGELILTTPVNVFVSNNVDFVRVEITKLLLLCPKRIE